MIFKSLTLHDAELHILELTKALMGYDRICQYHV